MRILGQHDIATLLPMPQAIEVVAGAMRAVSEGKAELPPRFLVPVGGANRMGVMPGALAEPACFGIKLISLFPGNAARGLSSHRGAMVLFEPETGGAVAMMDASLLTAVRTAAASAVATRELARADASELAIIGYGEQAHHHLDAMMAVRPIRSLRVAGRSAERAAEFAARARSRHPGLSVRSGDDIRAAVAGADIVCTVTAAPAPILFGDWLEPGMHLNIVGASIPSMREVDDETVLRSAIWVDHLAATLAAAGEIVDMIRAGRIDGSHLRGEIGAILLGRLAGRTGADQITAYRSLGLAAQDLAAAQWVLDRARALGLGHEVDF